MIDRRQYQCHKNECDSQATHQVCVRFFCTGQGKPPTEMRCTTTVQVCERHRSASRDFILSDRNRGAIRRALMRENLQAPDFSSAELIFIPIIDGKPVVEAAA